MDRPLLDPQSPAGYFRDRLESAMARQHVTAGDLTSRYLVNLLCQFVRADACDGLGRDTEPLAVRLARALDQDGALKRAQLQSLGDFSLFVSGFFADSFPRRTVDVDYYVSMGEYAYGSLSRGDREAFAVFGELSRRFVVFMDVLADVSEQTGSTSGADVLRLYEKWLKTGSLRDARRLLEHGILPNPAAGTNRLQ